MSFLPKPWLKFISPVLVLLWSVNILSAQNLLSSDKAGEEIFQARTKQFSEFADRFNFKTDFKGNAVTPEFAKKMPREKMLHLLFDLKDPRSALKEFIDLKNTFVNDVISHEYLIANNSPSVIAEAKARVIYKGAPRTISLFLKRELVGKGSIKWVLLAAKGDIFDIFIKDTSMVRFIPPASHETDFINLKRALEDTDHLQDYASSDYKPDMLTLFFYCIKTGILKYEYAEDVTYHIFDVPGWYFKVKDFNRNELNSGWLITDVMRNNSGVAAFLE